MDLTGADASDSQGRDRVHSFLDTTYGHRRRRRLETRCRQGVPIPSAGEREIAKHRRFVATPSSDRTLARDGGAFSLSNRRGQLVGRSRRPGVLRCLDRGRDERDQTGRGQDLLVRQRCDREPERVEDRGDELVGHETP